MRAILAILNFRSQTLSHQVGLNRSALTAISFATLLFAFSTIALMLSSLAIADEPSGANLAIPNAPLEGSATGNSSNTEMSLEELIQTGWARSRYRNQVAFDTNTGQIPTPKLEEFESEVKPRLVAACNDCHGEITQEGNIRIDTLNPNLHTGNDVDWWDEIFAVLSKGEMPPPEAGEMEAEDRRIVVDWLSNELHAASFVRRGTTPQSAFRRMTRYEFNYALQDLLGLPWNFARDLPPEAISADGFQNNAELLQLSVSQFQTFQRLAHSALNRATVRGEKPTPIRWAITMRDNAKVDWPKIDQQINDVTKAHQDDPLRLQTELDKLEQSFQQAHPRAYYQEITTKRNVPASWGYPGARHAIAPSNAPVIAPDDVTHVAIIPPAQWLNVELGNQLPDEGILRVRVRASRTDETSPRAPTLQLQFGWQASNEGRALLRVSEQEWEINATADAPEFYEWNIPLGEIYPRNSVRKTSPMGAMPSPSEYVRLVNSSASASAIRVDYVEVLAPVYDQWPPDSHNRVFIDSQNVNDESRYAREVISNFLHRAWRRPITDDELNQKMALFESVQPHCDTFEDAIIEVLAASLASPNFLFIVKAADSEESRSSQAPSHLSASRVPLSPHELATRLSVFLWCSIPDTELLELADTNALLKPGILEQQVKRMLADPRAHRFTELFVTQWLDLQRLDYINLNHEGRRFDPSLKESMLNEPIALFNEILTHNESVLRFLHADFVMINETLAKHYGINNVYGSDFRRVSLDGELRRGGLLTAAAPLTMNSDYPDSHPLKRGKWLLESLLNDPPPPPPPAVPEIDLADPEIAKMTLKERIEDHRNHPACISCHIKIDPWGIAFENYDALGLWRERIQGKPVDAQSELINHEPLNGIEGLKRFLLTERQDQFVRAFVTKLTTFALGRSLTFADQADLEAIAANARKNGDGLATIVQAIVENELFQSK